MYVLFSPGLICLFQDLGDVDPDLLQGLQQLTDYAGGDDEDVFGINFRVGYIYGILVYTPINRVFQCPYIRVPITA